MLLGCHKPIVKLNTTLTKGLIAQHFGNGLEDTMAVADTNSRTKLSTGQLKGPGPLHEIEASGQPLQERARTLKLQSIHA